MADNTYKAPASTEGLTPESYEALNYFKQNPKLLSTGSSPTLEQALGGGTMAPTIANPFTDPSASYEKYRAWNPNAYAPVTDEAYNLGNQAATVGGRNFAATGTDQAYEANLRALQAQQQMGSVANAWGSVGQQATGAQQQLAAKQAGLGDRMAGVQAGPVTGAQTLTGQQDYQGYLQQLQQGRGAANAMQAQSDMLGQQYQNADTTAAMMQMRQATDQSLASNLALAHSSQGAGGMARALTANAATQQTAAAQSAQLQAQQEQALRSAWLTSQGNTAQQYQALSQQQGQMAQMGSQSYLTAQKMNADMANQERQGLASTAGVYGQSGQGWGNSAQTQMAALQGQGNAAQNLYNAGAADRTAGLQLSQAQLGLKQQQQAQQYAEWVRQEQVRQSMGDRRYATMTGTQAANQASLERAETYNAGAAAKGQANAFQTVGSVTSAGVGAMGASAANKANAAQANSNSGSVQYQPTSGNMGSMYDNPDSSAYD